MAVTQTPVYQEIYEFLVSSPTPAEIIAFRPSEMTQMRVRTLLDANKENHLTPDEQIELDEFERAEHFMRMLKAHARQNLSQQ
jgi:hypothetical protein